MRQARDSLPVPLGAASGQPGACDDPAASWRAGACQGQRRAARHEPAGLPRPGGRAIPARRPGVGARHGPRHRLVVSAGSCPGPDQTGCHARLGIGRAADALARAGRYLAQDTQDAVSEPMAGRLCRAGACAIRLPSSYARLAVRRARRPDQLSTLEATCLALEGIEGSPGMCDPLVASFEGLLAELVQRGHGGPPRSLTGPAPAGD